ncbi:MAG: substrate-binding domain-containing protein, partial [Cyclobacteriaceae bacterium]
MNKILRTLLLVGLFAFYSCNSSQNEATGSGETDQLKIAVIPKGTTHFFWNHIHAGAAKAAKELDVEIIWQGPLKEDDRQMQIQVVQNFVSRSVDAIVLAPLDEQSLVPPVKAAMKREIPVIIIDSGLSSDHYLSFVATDNYLGGKLCAQQMIEILQGQGKVIMLRYQEGSASTT